MNRILKIIMTASFIFSISVLIIQALDYYNYLDLITKYVGYVTIVVDRVINLFRPLLEIIGKPLSNLVTSILNLFAYGDYTFYIGVSFLFIMIAFIMAIKLPGYDDYSQKKKNKNS